ncbi:MAG: hypothetical protein IJ708_15075 [Clostridia bacterium]|nr:hypothetical protein [Clostridia bacterium]
MRYFFSLAMSLTMAFICIAFLVFVTHLMKERAILNQAASVLALELLKQLASVLSCLYRFDFPNPKLGGLQRLLKRKIYTTAS